MKNSYENLLEERQIVRNAIFLFLLILVKSSVYALSDVGLVHRWTFDEGLCDFAGGQDMTTSDAISPNNGSCFLGGSDCRTRLSCVNGVASDSDAITVEMWATIYETAPQNYKDYSWDKRVFSCAWHGSNDFCAWPSDESLKIGIEYHFSLVSRRQGTHLWQNDFYIRDATSGTVLFHSHKDTYSASYASLNGYYLEIGGYTTRKSYNEIRMWNRALTEYELRQSVKEGPDTLRFSRIVNLISCGTYATNIVAKQRYPWNNLVDIEYDVVGQSEDPNCVLLQAIVDDGASVFTAKSVSGDYSFKQGHHKIVWDLDSDGISMTSKNVRFAVSSPLYCVVDLSGGVDASSYPVAWLSEKPTEGWTDEFKTSKMVFRWCGPGCEPDGIFASTRNYYAGIFEVTQGQFENLRGTYNGYGTAKGETLPALTAEVKIIGYCPADNKPYPDQSGGWNGVTNSCIARLRSRTKFGTIVYPSTNVWQYTCRGRSSPYVADNDTCWKRSNSSDSVHPVGKKLSNDKGLYDMYGNVWEITSHYVEHYSIDYGTYYTPMGIGGSYNTWQVDSSTVNTANVYTMGFRLYMAEPWKR